jgi:acid phosphatase type 7
MKLSLRSVRCGAVGVAAVALSGSTLLASSKESPKAAVMPGRVPERLVLGFAGDPVHTQAVTWRTSTLVEKPQAQIARFTADPAFQEQARSVAATTIRVALATGGEAFHYRVRFDGLEPATAYAYRVGDGTVWSEWCRLLTASEGVAPFRFIYLGDVQNSVKALWSQAVRAAYAHAPDARFILIAGDLVNEGWDDELWGEWCHALGFISSTVPILATPGNHDLHEPPPNTKTAKVSRVHPLWNAHLTHPDNGPNGVDLFRGEAWHLDYQGVTLIGLEANVYAEEDFDPAAKSRVQGALPTWLEGVLSAGRARWTVMLQHQPLYAVSKQRDFVELRDVMLPIIDRYHVDLVLQGHDHRYARTHKLARGGVVGAGEPGTVYSIAMSGPKPHAENPHFADLMAVRSGETQTYQIISVAGNRLRYEAYAITGELLDAFELNKDSAGASTYVNLAPVEPRSSGKGD